MSTTQQIGGADQLYIRNTGVYKQWTGLLEWWNSGMVDWIIFFFAFIIYHVVASLQCLHLPSYSHNGTYVAS